MKYVAFDVGNVLVHVDFPKFINKLSKTLNISVEDATYFMNRSQKLHDLGLTVMRDELIDHLHIKSGPLREELVDDWNSCINVEPQMVQMLNNVNDMCGLEVALVSNVGLEHAQRMEQILNINGFFDRATKHFSCEVGARKPTYLYFQSFLQLHPEWEGCLYVDDLQDNLNAGAKFGLKPYRFSLEEAWNGRDWGAFATKIKDLQKTIISMP